MYRLFCASAKLSSEKNCNSDLRISVKKYLRDNCDFSCNTLKENMPKALADVHPSTMRLREHRMYRWMEACRSGLGATDAQLRVGRFGSTMYKSHRCIPEAVACAFD